MQDIFHDWGGDLAVGPTGDLLIASAAAVGQQRVLRRLLTNLGDYIWQLGYGAGLAQFVGTPANARHIRAIVRSQIFREPAVANTPEPTITVAPNPDGSVFVQLRYTDAATSATELLSFSLDA